MMLRFAGACALLLCVVACDANGGPSALGVLRPDSTRSPDSSDASKDGGSKFADGDAGNDAGDRLGFGHLGADGRPVVETEAGSTPTAPTELPHGWACSKDFGLDAICDCGCGAIDEACAIGACIGPDCAAPACEACFDGDGAFRTCAEFDTWTCRRGRMADGVCDCGCGIPDPDCESVGCVFPGCAASACERCLDADGKPAPCDELPEFACESDLLGDGQCDCGCGRPDPDCRTGSCAAPGCFDDACQVCHGPGGEGAACESPEPQWHCDPATRTDGTCDCGCGIADPDCEGEGCTGPGCGDAACSVCHDPFGRTIPCPGKWQCSARIFGDDHCDCGCGAPDPDCMGSGCSGGGCEADACERRHDEGQPIAPDSFACDPAQYGSGDGCHCGCGASDPDCREAGCSEPGCRADGCLVCLDESGDTVDCNWRCVDALQDNGQCDCGCGTLDPDCAHRACVEPGCFSALCDTCHGDDGAVVACQRSGCPRGFKQNGVCDCGCRELDPECQLPGSCVEPGCSDRACGVCHGDDGSSIPCQHWTCSFEQHGAGDGCNCGCGALDPDCAPEVGCAEAGCAVPACTTCRDSKNAPTECDP